MRSNNCTVAGGLCHSPTVLWTVQCICLVPLEYCLVYCPMPLSCTTQTVCLVTLAYCTLHLFWRPYCNWTIAGSLHHSFTVLCTVLCHWPTIPCHLPLSNGSELGLLQSASVTGQWCGTIDGWHEPPATSQCRFCSTTAPGVNTKVQTHHSCTATATRSHMDCGLNEVVWTKGWFNLVQDHENELGLTQSITTLRSIERYSHIGQPERHPLIPHKRYCLHAQILYIMC